MREREGKKKDEGDRWDRGKGLEGRRKREMEGEIRREREKGRHGERER